VRLSVLPCILAALSGAAAATAPQYLRVTTATARLHAAPSTQAPVVASAALGDVFRISSSKGEWYAVVVASGEYRYLHRSTVVSVPGVPALPESEAARRAAALAVVKAQDQATDEAIRRFPNDLNRQIDLERSLSDKLILDALHKHSIAPARYSELAVEAARKKWLP